MTRMMGITVVVLVMAVAGTEGFARGGRGAGSGGGGQQRLGNVSGSSQYGSGGQLGAMQQQQMMQQRMMQQQIMQQQMLQNRYRMMQSQGGGAYGMQQQRLRDGSCGGQATSGQATGTGQMMRNRQRLGQSGNGRLSEVSRSSIVTTAEAPFLDRRRLSGTQPGLAD
jgi:hypothetical protein